MPKKKHTLSEISQELNDLHKILLESKSKLDHLDPNDASGLEDLEKIIHHSAEQIETLLSEQEDRIAEQRALKRELEKKAEELQKEAEELQKESEERDKLLADLCMSRRKSSLPFILR